MRSRRHSWRRSRPTRCRAAATSCTSPFDARVQVCLAGLDFSNPARLLWELTAAIPFIAFCAAPLIRNATAEQASGYRVMGLPGPAPNGYRDFSYGRRLSTRADVSRVAAVTERADVVIVGSGFGGSITAWRLAELYRAAGVDPQVRSSCSSGAVGTAIPTFASRRTSTISRTSTC